MSKLKVYYAHSLSLYGTPIEKKDVELLEVLGFEVVNPNTEGHQKKCEEIRASNPSTEITSHLIMSYFEGVAGDCDAVAFRAHIDGKIPAGVGKEVTKAMNAGKPVIELPNLVRSRFLEVGETRQYLHYLGQR